MATTRTKSAPKRKQSTARRKSASSTSVARRRNTSNRRASSARHLPGWSDLSPKKGRRGKGKVRTIKKEVPLPMSTARFLAVLLIVATASTIYVGHIYDTQDLYAEVQQMRRQNLRLHLKHNRLKGEFDRATGPNTIYKRARTLGLTEDFTYGPVIHLDPK